MIGEPALLKPHNTVAHSSQPRKSSQIRVLRLEDLDGPVYPMTALKLFVDEALEAPLEPLHATREPRTFPGTFENLRVLVVVGCKCRPLNLGQTHLKLQFGLADEDADPIVTTLNNKHSVEGQMCRRKRRKAFEDAKIVPAHFRAILERGFHVSLAGFFAVVVVVFMVSALTEKGFLHFNQVDYNTTRLPLLRK